MLNNFLDRKLRKPSSIVNYVVFVKGCLELSSFLDILSEICSFEGEMKIEATNKYCYRNFSVFKTVTDSVLSGVGANGAV
jgi:hypothetical protein